MFRRDVRGALNEGANGRQEARSCAGIPEVQFLAFRRDGEQTLAALDY